LQVLCSKTKVVSAEVVRPTRRQIYFGLKQFWLNGRDNIHSHLVLQRKNIAQVTFKSISPKVRAGRGIDQLAGDADLSGCLAHAAFQHVANTEFAPDLFDIDGPPFVSKARIARDHE
jgi:hypothetical protein